MPIPVQQIRKCPKLIVTGGWSKNLELVPVRKIVEKGYICESYESIYGHSGGGFPGLADCLGRLHERKVQFIKGSYIGAALTAYIVTHPVAHSGLCIKSFDINLKKEQVVIESYLPSSRLVEILESTGKRAVLVGYGSSKETQNLGAAVAMIEAGNHLIRGVVRFVQSDESRCVIDGTIDGLQPGLHAVCVHELGDLTQGCLSCGRVYSGVHGGENTAEAPLSILQKFQQLVQRTCPAHEKIYGHIGDVHAGEDGRAVFRLEKADFQVWDVIGRSMVIHKGTTESLKQSDQEKNRLACGIIARSAGLFENSKKICACDGVTLWDERDVPVAGGSRQATTS